jgi:hypothetical protein
MTHHAEYRPDRQRRCSVKHGVWKVNDAGFSSNVTGNIRRRAGDRHVIAPGLTEGFHRAVTQNIKEITAFMHINPVP